MKKSISYNKFVRNVIILSMVIVVGLFILYGTYIQSNSIEKSIKQDTKVMTDLVFQNLYTVMKSGGDKALLNQTIKNIEENIPHVNIKIFKASDETQKDVVLEAMKTKESHVLRHDEHIDFATPILFKAECIKCHTTAHVNDMAAAILIEHPILDLKISLKEILTMASILFIIIILVFFTMWYYFLRKYFINPIKALIEQIHKNATHNDLNESININTNIKEILHLEKVFNKKNKALFLSYNKLEQVSNTDKLTGIYNRKKFEEYTSLVLSEAKRYKHIFSLILIDLNKFKPINDTYGHDTGDAVLIFFSRIILESIRETDYLFRIGGDEFVLLLNNTSFDESKIIIQKIKEKLNCTLFEKDPIELEISASFGIAQYSQDGENIDALLKVADQRMYEDKQRKHS